MGVFLYLNLTTIRYYAILYLRDEREGVLDMKKVIVKEILYKVDGALGGAIMEFIDTDGNNYRIRDAEEEKIYNTEVGSRVMLPK